MRRVTVTERRARLLRRHHLAAPAEPVAVAHDLVGLHSSDPATPFVGLRARSTVTSTGVEHLLYEERRLARVLAMRRTLFVVDTRDVAMLHAACTSDLVEGERRRTVRLLEGAGIGKDPDRWLAAVEEATLAALRARGPATAAELSADVPELRERIPVGQGRRWETTIGVSTRVLFLLATRGLIVRGRPQGSWTSTRYRWAPLADWLGLEDEGPPPEAARAALARRWLLAFGPATEDDLRWWTGWTLKRTRAALAQVGPVEVDIAGTAGLLAPGDDEPVGEPAPRAALLPQLDSTVMGWKQRDWYLGAHAADLFDRNGNAGATVWWQGRVVGGWAQHPDGDIAVRLLEDVGRDAREAIAAEQAALAAWLGDVRIVPRFRTPLERALTG